MDENTPQPIPEAGRDQDATQPIAPSAQGANPTMPLPATAGFASPDGSRALPPVPQPDGYVAQTGSLAYGAATPTPGLPSRPVDSSQPAGTSQPGASPYQPVASPYQSGATPYPAYPHGAPAPGWSAQSAYGDASAQQPHGAYGAPLSSGSAFGPTATMEATAKAARPRPSWAAIVTTAAVTALLVGGGSAMATSALLGSDGSDTTASTSISGLGQGSTISVDSVSAASWEEVAARVAPSVVAIDVTTSSSESQGSGVIIDTAGYILTNNHVVTGATDDTVTVTLSDGRLYEATIVGLDSATDLAVIKIVSPPDDLTAATLADSDEVVVGNAVMAVGNPLGLANTVTTGIVSALARPVTTSDETDGTTVVTNAIQIDAAINPGNSGGPLFNSDGEVIGITSSIATLSSTSETSGSIGLGFAIPSNLASSVSEQLITSGTAEHAFLGVALSDSTATADDVTRRGALVEQVTEGSPAEVGGVKVGDVIVALDGQAVNGAEFLTAAVRERVEGDLAVLTIVRDGVAQEITVTLAAKTDDSTSTEGESSEEEQDGSEQTTPQWGGSQLPNGSSEGEIPGGMTQDQLYEWLQEQQ